MTEDPDTDTPQSDAALLRFSRSEHGKECEFVPLKVSRQIERDLYEQCVLLGKSAERECALLAKIDRLELDLNYHKGLLIRLYNDLFVHHKGEAVKEFKALFREENYN